MVATDASAAALAVARSNAARSAWRNVDFRQGDWFAPLAGERFELIASNPPYIAERDPHLGQGDLRHEPFAALASGRDGLDEIRDIVRDAPARLRRAAGCCSSTAGSRATRSARCWLAPVSSTSPPSATSSGATG